MPANDVSDARISQTTWIAGLMLAAVPFCSPWFRGLGEALTQALLSLMTLLRALSGGQFPFWSPMMMLVVLSGISVSSPAAAEPAASADRQTVVYTSFRPANQDLYLLTADGSARRLTEHPALDYNPALSPDGRWLVFCSERGGGSNLWLLDLEHGGKPRALTTSPALDDAPAFSPDGRRLAFVSTRDGEAGVYVMPFRPDDPAAAEAEAVLLTGAAGGDFNPAFSPDGQRIAFSSNRDVPGGDGSQVYVMAADGSGQTKLTDGEGWNGSPAFSADGSKVYYHHATFHRGPRLDVATATIRSVAAEEPLASTAWTAEDGLAAWPAVDGDGRMVYAAHREGGWRIVERSVEEKRGEDGGERVVGRADVDLQAPTAAGGRLVAQGPGPMSGPRYEDVLHPLGPLPFLAAEAASRTVLHRQARGGLELDLQPVRHPHPIPDPTRRRWLTSILTLAVSTLDGSGRREILRPENPAEIPGMGDMVWGPSWSPDGEWIAAVVGPIFAPPEAAADIWLVRPDGSGARNLTADSEANDGFPDFSPDGRWIVFRSGRDGGKHELYLMNADGTGVRRLTEHEATDTMPAFSPRGDEIAFVSTRDGNYEVYTMKLDAEGAAGEIRRVTTSPGFDMHPRYSPDGEWLVITTDRYGFSDERPFEFIPMPSGELAAVRLSDLHTVRLTANKWEDGVGIWVREPLPELLAGGPGTEGIQSAP